MTERIFPVITDSDLRLPYYLLDAGYGWEQEYIKRPEGYHYQWIQCARGEGELRTAEKTFRIGKGCAMLLLAGQYHEYYAVSPSWTVDWVVFDGRGVEPYLKENAGLCASGGFYLTKPERTRARMYGLLEAARSEEALKGPGYSAIVYSLLTDIAQCASLSPADGISGMHSRLQPLFGFIAEHYAEPLSLEELAGVAGVTPEYLCTVFKKSTGLRLFQYINSLRVRKGKELLLGRPRMPVGEIAGLCGFEDPNYFCAVFKKLAGLSPGQFRRMNGR